MTDTTERNDFSQGSIPGTILRMSMPVIGAQIVNALYSIVDRMYIGNLPEIGAPALTGVGVTFPFIMIVSAFAALAGMGGAPLCSIARGERRPDYAERVMGNSVFLLAVFGLLLPLIALPLRNPLLYWFGASAETFPYANEYLGLYLIGSPFVMCALGLAPFINAQGFTGVTMRYMMISCAANIALDPLFMFAFGMGVKGAALATVLSQALSALLILRFLTGKRCILRLTARSLAPDPAILRRILALGASSCTMNVTECIVSIVCNSTLQTFGGDTYVGVMTIISSVRQVVMMPVSGFGQGLQPVIGYNYGARRYDRVREAFRFVTMVSIVYSAVVCLIMQFFPAVFLRLFNPSETLIEAGVPAIRLYFGLFFMLAFQMAGQYSFVALGKSRQAMFFSLLRKAFIVAPLALILPRVTPLGVMGVFAAEPVSDFVGSAACFLTFMLTIWPTLKDEPQDRILDRP